MTLNMRNVYRHTTAFQTELGIHIITGLLYRHVVLFALDVVTFSTAASTSVTETPITNRLASFDEVLQLSIPRSTGQ
jgi:hypothetical protein